MRIVERRLNFLDYKIFDISFKGSFLAVKSVTFDLRSFYRKKYLAQLIRNFKQEDYICSLLILITIITVKTKGLIEDEIRKILLPAEEQIKKALSLATSYKIISYIKPFKKFFVNYNGRGVYFLTIEDVNIRNISEILDCMDSINTCCYFIFNKPSDTEALFSKIEKLYKENNLNDRAIINLSLEFIKIVFGAKEVEEEFKIFTCRFNKEELKDIILNSTFTDAERFEVVLK